MPEKAWKWRLHFWKVEGRIINKEVENAKVSCLENSVVKSSSLKALRSHGENNKQGRRGSQCWACVSREEGREVCF